MAARLLLGQSNQAKLVEEELAVGPVRSSTFGTRSVLPAGPTTPLRQPQQDYRYSNDCQAANANSHHRLPRAPHATGTACSTARRKDPPPPRRALAWCGVQTIPNRLEMLIGTLYL
jgi:hypothetical protein